jgi:hypothetical protein
MNMLKEKPHHSFRFGSQSGLGALVVILIIGIVATIGIHQFRTHKIGQNSPSTDQKESLPRELLSKPAPAPPPAPSATPATYLDNPGRGDGKFINYGNGTVLDMRTGMMWAATDNGNDIDWNEADRYCRAFRGGGYADWRMPTQEELATLYDEGQSRPPACSSTSKIHMVTELIDITCLYVWASENRGSEVALFFFTPKGRSWARPAGSVFGRAMPIRSAQ